VDYLKKESTRDYTKRTPRIDKILGKKFHKLTYLEHVASDLKSKSRIFKAQCDCGNFKLVSSSQARHVQSCGCSNVRAFQDVSNLRYGSLVALRYVGLNNDRVRMWEFICDCGNKTVARLSSVKVGATKSCGCQSLKQLKYQRYLGENVSNLSTIFNDYNKKAKKRKLDFKLTFDEFKRMIIQNCYYCGIPPSNIKKGYKDLLMYNGIDRKESNVGYLIDNVVPCCFKCNQAKGNKNIKEFLSIIKNVYEHLNLCNSPEEL